MSNYIVLVKQVPDITQITDNAFDPETGTLVRTRLASVINELDTQALAFADRMRLLTGKRDSRIIALTMGPPMAEEVLRYCLSRCADAAVLLTDRNPVPWQGGYWYLKDNGFKPRQALKMYKADKESLVPEPQWEKIRQGLRGTVVALVRGIRSGEFPVCNTDQQCTGRCPYRTICRINQVRSLGKTWQPNTQSV